MLFKTRLLVCSLVLSLLLCSRGLAYPFSDSNYGFTVDIPDGFIPDPNLAAKKPTILYAFRKPGNADLLSDPRIIIERMGGQLQRGPIRPEELPKNFNGTLFITRWRNFDINAARITENIGGDLLVTYKAQVPLRHEAIQIWSSGPLDQADQPRALLDRTLASLNGESSWLESPVLAAVSDSIFYKVGLLVAALLAVATGLAALLQIRRRHPRGTVLGLSCFIYAIGWLINPGRISEMHLVVGCFRLLGVLGFIVGLIDLAKKRRIIPPALPPYCAACNNHHRPGAEFCGQCGRAATPPEASVQKPPMFFGKVALMSSVVIALIVPVILVLCSSSGSSPASETAQARAVPANLPPSVVPPTAPVSEPTQPLATLSPAPKDPVAVAPRLLATPVNHVRMVQAKTAMVGGRGGGPFTTVSPTNQPVIGFEYSTDKWMGKTIVRSFTPIFPGDDGIAITHALIARPGYAVGAIEVNGDDYVRAVKVIFMKFSDGKLHPDDSYSSDWVNTPTDRSTYRLAGNGDRVVGTFGSRGLNVDGLGLVVLTPVHSDGAR